jgi:alkanesulfonate monooxygenase SsuD/methylene tetrahydromethanopterin reductase-like flavin-dependent oxidoreductase (luciferase family)
VVAIAKAALVSGFDSFWFCDPGLLPAVTAEPEEPELEAFTTLGALSQLVSGAGLAAIMSASDRHPAVLAKQVTALDVLSSGRAILAVTAQDPDGVFRLREAMEIWRSMFRAEVVDFDGRYYKLSGAANRPRPVQVEGPPIVIAARRDEELIELIAESASACIIEGDPEVVRSVVGDLDRACLRVDREPHSVSKLCQVPARVLGHSGSSISRYLEVGVDGFLVQIADDDDESVVESVGLAASVAMAGTPRGGAIA